MEIIDELEPERRDVYAGCIGYFGATGEMDTCIALRTALVKDGRMYVQAGGGIVADSDPRPSSRKAATRPGRWSGPPRRPCVSPRRPAETHEDYLPAIVKWDSNWRSSSVRFLAAITPRWLR
jgi:hypothetical protein